MSDDIPFWKQGLKDQPKPVRSGLLRVQSYFQHGKRFLLAAVEPDGDEEYQSAKDMAGAAEAGRSKETE